MCLTTNCSSFSLPINLSADFCYFSVLLNIMALWTKINFMTPFSNVCLILFFFLWKCFALESMSEQLLSWCLCETNKYYYKMFLSNKLWSKSLQFIAAIEMIMSWMLSLQLFTSRSQLTSYLNLKMRFIT
jgi:hypothetical protein